MPTTNVAINSDAYTLVVTATDAIVQNTSTFDTNVVFAIALPASDAKGHVLETGEFIQISGGVPSGNCYAKSVKSTGTVAVSV